MIALVQPPSNGCRFVPNESSLTYKPFSPVSGSPQGGAIGGSVSSNPVQIKAIDKVSADLTGFTYKVTTTDPHFRTTNNSISLAQVFRPGTDEPAQGFQGTFPITAYDPAKPNELKCTLREVPETEHPKVFDAYAKRSHIGLNGAEGLGIIAERNRVFNCGVGGPYHDTFNAREIVGRDNWLSDVIWGPAFILARHADVIRPLLSLKKEYDSTAHKWKITARSAVWKIDSLSFAYHGLEKGEIVHIEGAGHIDYPHSEQYNGNFKIIDVPNPDEFVFYLNEPAVDPEIDSDSAADLDDDVLFGVFSPYGRTLTDSLLDTFSAGQYARIWKMDKVLFEGNIIELSARSLYEVPNGHGGFEANSSYHCSGFICYLGGFPPQNIIEQFIFRNNIIRHVDNLSDPGNLKYNNAVEINSDFLVGVGPSGVDSALIEKNLVRLDNVANGDASQALPQSPAPIEYRRGTGIATFDNRSVNAVLLRPVNIDTPRDSAVDLVTTLENAIEEVVLLSLLK